RRAGHRDRRPRRGARRARPRGGRGALRRDGLRRSGAVLGGVARRVVNAHSGGDRGLGGTPRRDAVSTDWRLYLVTDPRLGGGRDAVPGIGYEEVRGGVGVVQFRDKECEDEEFRRRTRAVAEAARRAGAEVGRAVPVFVNDRLAV